MPASYRVKVEGFADLGKALAELPKSISKATMVRVLAKAAAPILRDAQARAPVRADGASHKYYGGTVEVVDGHKKRVGGKLRRTGTDRALVQAGTRLTRRQAGIARKEGKSEAEYYVGTRDPAARLVEYGTVNVPAYPVIRPAWEANREGALQIIKDELGGEIDKSAKRVARKAARLAAKGS